MFRALSIRGALFPGVALLTFLRGHGYTSFFFFMAWVKNLVPFVSNVINVQLKKHQRITLYELKGIFAWYLMNRLRVSRHSCGDKITLEMLNIVGDWKLNLGPKLE